MVTLTQTDIERRRAEVEGQLGKAQAVIETLQAELADLDATERTFSRMGGAERRAPRPADRAPAANAGKTRTRRPKTTSEMILAVMREMGRSLEPREIADAIDAKGWGPVNRDAIRTRIWHMVRDGKLLREGAAYSLSPANKNPTGDDSEGNEPAGLFSPAQGGEARPGGGT